jgi:UDP-N-acetylmuramoyl-L-alanyl-D-glutamate--2,6-diaminopimelate ligase
MGIIASELHDKPSLKIPLIGVTGTNGKTSVTQWFAQLMSLIDQKTGVIGTLGAQVFQGGNSEYREQKEESQSSVEIVETGFTTPQSSQTQQLLSQFNKQGSTQNIIEVSSIGWCEKRVSGCTFTGAVFTNLTRDHLDYHGSMEHYEHAKQEFLTQPHLKWCVLNLDDRLGIKTLDVLKNKCPKTLKVGYGLNKNALFLNAHYHFHDFILALNIEHHHNGMSFEIHSERFGIEKVHVSFFGLHNISNILAVVSTALQLGYDFHKVCKMVPFLTPVSGRLEIIKKQPLILVDYAHTPDGLEKALLALVPLRKNSQRLICIIGCGGNRDTGKRPLMAQIATQNTDITYFTTDNPRFENPANIIEDMLRGIRGTDLDKKAIVIENRELCIQEVLMKAQPHDIILIAGKGHENYQEIQGIKHHYSDIEVVERFFN